MGHKADRRMRMDAGFADQEAQQYDAMRDHG